MILHICQEFDIWREENTVDPSYLHIHGFNQSMENIWGKNSMIFQKTQLEFATHLQLFTQHLNYIWVSLVAQTVKNLPAMQETWFDPWIGKIPWRRKWPPTPVFLPGEFHGQRSLVGYSPWGRKESDMTERLT